MRKRREKTNPKKSLALNKKSSKVKISQEEEKVDDFGRESSSEVIRRRPRKRPGLLDSDSDSNDSD